MVYRPKADMQPRELATLGNLDGDSDDEEQVRQIVLLPYS